jgi:uncharacterized protein (DUF1697 family)
VTRYIAFLRALNVGGHTIKMDVLRGLFAEIGFGEVSTYIASGNVLFAAGEENAPALERRIEDHLRAALGYEVATFLRTPQEVAAVVEYRSFDPDEINHALGLMIAFLKTPPGVTERERLQSYRRPSDDFAVHGREIYWLRRTQQSETNFGGATLERVLGAPTTIRSITTVRKLAELSRAGK